MNPITENVAEECIDACNKLLRGELAAVETYSQAIEKFDTEVERTALETIRADHQNSVNELRRHLTDMGAVPDESSGAWGNFAGALEGSAKLLGESPALAVLEQGEKHGISEYEEALANPRVMREIKDVIRARLLPPLDEHIAALSRLRNK